MISEILQCRPKRSKLFTDLESIHFYFPLLIIDTKHKFIVAIEIIQVNNLLRFSSSTPFP